MEQPPDETPSVPPGAPPPTRAQQLPLRPLPRRQPSQTCIVRPPADHPVADAVGRADAVGCTPTAAAPPPAPAGGGALCTSRGRRMGPRRRHATRDWAGRLTGDAVTRSTAWATASWWEGHSTYFKEGRSDGRIGPPGVPRCPLLRAIVARRAPLHGRVARASPGRPLWRLDAVDRRCRRDGVGGSSGRPHIRCGRRHASHPPRSGQQRRSRRCTSNSGVQVARPRGSCAAGSGRWRRRRAGVGRWRLVARHVTRWCSGRPAWRGGGAACCRMLPGPWGLAGVVDACWGACVLLLAVGASDAKHTQTL